MSNHKLVVGAARHGSVLLMPDGVQLTRLSKYPSPGFGYHVDMNRDFIVVGGWEYMEHVTLLYLYVYQTQSPYTMITKILVDDSQADFTFVISDDNTIAVCAKSELFIFKYDGSATWKSGEHFYLEGTKNSLSIYKDILVVGSNHVYIVRVYNRVGGKWTQGQTIQEEGVRNFGWSVAIYGQHMAVGLFGKRHDSNLFTYKLDQQTNMWVSNGNHSVSSDSINLSLHKDMLVATVNHGKNHTDVNGVVFKLSAATTTNNNEILATKSNNIIKGDLVWKEFARLTTKNDPMTYRDDKRNGVSIEDQVVFIGRPGRRQDGNFGRVYAYDLSKYNN